MKVRALFMPGHSIDFTGNCNYLPPVRSRSIRWGRGGEGGTGREKQRESEKERTEGTEVEAAMATAERVNWVSVVELENFASVMRERRRLPSRSHLNCVYESTAAVGR